MASLRNPGALFRSVSRLQRIVPVRSISSGSGAGARRLLRPLLLGLAGTGTAYGVYHYKTANDADTLTSLKNVIIPGPILAAAQPDSQPSVFSQGKDHALYLWIYLKPTSSPKEVVKSVAKLQHYVNQVSDPKLRDESDEVWAGVGFGQNFYRQVGGKTKKNYAYPYRKGALGEMPSSGGDIFIHAKSNEVSKLFELAQVVLKNLPKDSVHCYEDIYSFVYQNGRDLSGFIDGTENAADEESRQKIAVEKETGGSYVITQKWIHNHDVIANEKDSTLSGWVGRERADSTELKKKSITSHVARMTGGNAYEQPKPVEIVRQSMPFGSLSKDSGLFFIAYAASPENFEYMLDRMVGAGGDCHSDDIMRLTKNVKGTYWYFPGAAELKRLE